MIGLIIGMIILAACCIGMIVCAIGMGICVMKIDSKPSVWVDVSKAIQNTIREDTNKKGR